MKLQHVNIFAYLQVRALNPSKVTLAGVLTKGKRSPYRQGVAVEKQIPIPNPSLRAFVP